MKNAWTEKWDQRYAEEEFAYGEQPNNFLQQQLSLLKPGKILFPAEGEGRNAVFAAGLGWAVSAFDISIEGQKKALKLAEKKQVAIDYRVGELQELNYTEEQFDVIALIYAHFPPNIKSFVHQTLDKYLNTGGLIIFEAFSKSHLDYLAKDEKMGGPRDIESLFSLEEVKIDFNNYEILELLETEIHLNEGPYHSGQGSVIRFVGRKKLVGAIV
ncbi:class I SAM-dependent methyltransferase [Mucilaginibacter rubeus]|uniref:Class I SAM-dependent methyltransferase n=2 Tax=Mucilaginibacter TaxID=423349 RepID=A0AAE6JB62_9SPHI|nr:MULTISPECIES: methyltransferase domain-containing protein [Mucilaginibacter]QEM02266.1 class I SAM-dependent methyltransferase [Mucilaginibacter rubeus]QEM14892.1 class I SAM-dependent methyltransferase [Mucilaginibacter gossypii]QTE42393.1 methyltransferase domain-containing protein [Mucilaginibacter rubeus]QTE48996.1 methyltransferase domain-containing protein [Mucilaginibacter rubeus]QTE54094.1 methyltransferase domain-containing protein [Mucilaginibacter rubeus]